MADKPRSKKILIGSLLTLAVIVLLVAVAPMVLSLGPAATIARNAISPYIEGDVSIESVRLRWFGEQRITALTVTEPNGREAVAADGTLHHGLFRTLFARPSVMDVSLVGMLRGEVHEDGTFSFQHLVRTEPDPDEPFGLEGLPGLRITLEPSAIELLIAATNDIVLFRETAGLLTYQAGRPATLELRSATESAGMTGSFHAAAHAENMFDRDGRFTPRGATVDSQVELTSLPLRAGRYHGTLHQFALTAHADDLAELLRVNLMVDGVLRGVGNEIDNEEPEDSHLRGDIQLASLFADDGTLTFGLGSLRGEAHGQRVPSALFQPIFAATPVMLTRDAGPIVNVDAAFMADAPGQPPDDETAQQPTTRRIIRTDMHVIGEDAELEIRAAMNLDEGTWEGEHLRLIMPRAHPRLIQDYTTMIPDRPVDMEVVLTHFFVPPVDPARDQRRLPDYAATGTLRINQPVVLTLPDMDEVPGDDDSPLTIDLEELDLAFESPRLRDWAHVVGSARAEGGSLELDQRLSNIFDEEDAVALESIFAEGTLTASDWPVAPVARLIPEYEQLALETIGERATIDLRTERVSDSLRVAADATTPRATLALVALRHLDSLEIEEADINATITPRALTLLPLEEELPATLVRDAPVHVMLSEPVRFPRTGPLEYDWMPDRLRAVVESEDLAVADVPGLAEPAAMRSFRTEITAAQTASWEIEASGNGQLYRVENNAHVLDAEFNLFSRVDRDDAAAGGTNGFTFSDANYSLDASNVALDDLEALLGWEGAELAMLVGQAGRFSIRGQLEMERQTLSMDMNFDRLDGTFDASVDPQRLTLNSPGVNLRVAPGWLEPYLNQVNPDSGQPAGGLPGRVRVTEDFPVNVRITSFDLPRTQNAERPFSFGQAAVNAELTTGNLATQIGGQNLLSRLDNIRATFATDRLGRDIGFTLEGDTYARVEGVDEAGSLNLTGTVLDLLDEEGQPDWDRVHFIVDGTIEHAPTVILDALFNMRGYLLAAVGPAVTSTIDAQNFSAHSGTLDLDITTTFGWLRAHGEGRDGAIFIAAERPLEAQLEINPLMRERLLPMIHPLLGDILVSDRPLQLDVGNANIPFDADVSRLNADINLLIGDVELDSRSPMFGVLALAQAAAGRPLASSFDPIHAQVRDGILTYDRFLVHVAGLDLPYQGRINLNDQSVELSTTVPFGAIATAALPRDVRDLPIGRFSDVLDDISVPIVTTGRFGELRTRADPQIDLGSIVQRMIQQALRNDDEENDRPFPFPFPFPRR